MWKRFWKWAWTGPVIAGIVAGLIIGRWSGSSKQVQRERPAVLKQVQGLSDLVTVKYVIEKVIDFEDVKWYGENRVLLVAHGIVKAGINLGKLKSENLKIDGDQIRIDLPAPEITDVYLDDQKTQIIEHRTGLLRGFDKDLEQGARQQAIDDIRRAARYSGIYDEARKQARLQLSVFLRTLGFCKIDFVSR